MSANEFFFYSAGLAALVFTVVVLFLAYQVYLTIKTLKESAKSLEGAVREAGIVKDTLKFGLITFLSNSLAKILGKGGEKL